MQSPTSQIPSYLVTPADWACIKLSQASFSIDENRKAELLADARKFDACDCRIKQLEQLNRDLQERILRLGAK